MGVAYYVLRRILTLIPTVFAIILLSFLIMHIAPGDPIVFLIGGEEGLVGQELYELYRGKFGLDRPIYEQLFIYIKQVLLGDLGYSIIYNMPVFDLIMERLPYTVLLMISSLIFAVVAGIISGLISATKPYSLRDRILTFFSTVAYATPSFLVGVILLMVFGYYLRALPLGGYMSIGASLTPFEEVIDRFVHVILPSIALGAYPFTLVSRLIRSNVFEVLTADYITAARAKGVSERVILFKHALRNALLPTITFVATIAAKMLSGAIVIEMIFSWPGIGQLMYSALQYRDYPVIQGIFIWTAITVIVANLAVDILYGYVDPRIKY